MTGHYEWRGAGQVVSPADSEKTRRRLGGFWFHCEPAKGTPAATYLIRRGLDWLIPHEDVRFRPECSHPTGVRLPAMIWQVRNAAGSVSCLHRTYLTWDGHKAAVDPPKATWGSFSGGAIRLHPACHEMLVGEGVETTASAATILGIPGWAGIACGNLKSRMALPDTVRSVTIAVDHDPPVCERQRAPRPGGGKKDEQSNSPFPMPPEKISTTFCWSARMPDGEGFTLSSTLDIPAEFSDESLALRFTEQHGNTLRYVAAWGRWYEWDGAVWRQDGTLRVFDLARRLCRQASGECEKEKAAAAIASAKTVAAVERLAKADRRHAATIEQWDADEWLLNTPGGVVDLKTGQLRPHRPTDYMTKITAVAPGGACPLWHDVLDKVTAGDADLQAYLKRVIGYSLTGNIREHAMFFFFGTGGNGKGVVINTTTGIMKDYAAVASMETFTASQGDRHPTDLAMLRGARLVTAQETEEGRRWAESRIKALTGGDPVTARFMRMDFFTYQPVFKLLIAGNHRPGLRGVDEAIRRRMNLLPFTVTIPSGDRDPELPEKLQKEWPGILAWAIEGCLEWQEHGLGAPAAVTAATADYLDAEDALASWLAECCLPDQKADLPPWSSALLYSSWRTWAERAGEYAGSQKRFTQSMVSKGYTSERITEGTDKGKMGLRGLRLAPNSTL